MFQLSAPDFQLSMTLIGRITEELSEIYLNWLQCCIRLSTPGFEVDVDWLVMPREVESFIEAVIKLQAKRVPGSKAVLASQERGFRLLLEMMDERGHGLGTLEIQDSLPEGAMLSGKFGFDQTYLPSIESGLKQLLSVG